MSRNLTADEMTEVKRKACALGGRLLSKSLIPHTLKLRFECGQEHRFELSSKQLGHGYWCNTCAKAMKNQVAKATSFARLQRIVEVRGGRILSPAFISSRTPLQLECSEGHVWSAIPKDILRGGWCRACSLDRSNPRVLDRRAREVRHARRFVRKQRGQIVGSVKFTLTQRIRVRCEQGHEWETYAQHLLVEVWCQQCLKDQMLQRAREVARAHGGECLSDQCTSRENFLLWRCAHGHVFRAREGTVRDGIWCARCHTGDAMTIEAMRELAATRGGLCMSEEYRGAAHKLLWQCRDGHTWMTEPSSIRQGRWCRICRNDARHRSRRWTMHEIHQLAFECWGRCLSEKCQGVMVPLKWQCARGHSWDSAPMQVQQGHWCPICARRVPGSLAGMAELAAEHGGRVLTSRWIDFSVPIEFECAKGHRFAHQSVIAKSGAWCPVCRFEEQRTLEVGERGIEVG